MAGPLFSVIHPTLARPHLAITRCEEWFQKASRPDLVEYVFGVHSFDTAENIRVLEEFAAGGSRLIRVGVTPRRGSASNWDQAASLSEGVVLVQAQDDLSPPEHWDEKLVERFERIGGADWQGKPIFVGVSDGHRTDALCITSIMTRIYRDQRGFFLYPEYEGVYADDDSTAQAYTDAGAGLVTLIEARDIVFKHEHYSHPGGMAFDETYAIENEAAAYQKGGALFQARHPFWHFAQMCKRPPGANS